MTPIEQYINDNIDATVVCIKKILSWLLPSILGVSTKLAYESKSKTITKLRVVTSFVMAVFVGYLCDKMCTYYKWSEVRGIIVSIGALASETIVQHMLENINRKNITEFIKRLLNARKPN